MKGQSVGSPVDGLTSLGDLFHATIASPEDLDVFETIDTLQDEGLHLSQPFAIAHSHAPS